MTYPWRRVTPLRSLPSSSKDGTWGPLAVGQSCNRLTVLRREITFLVKPNLLSARSVHPLLQWMWFTHLFSFLIFSSAPGWGWAFGRLGNFWNDCVAATWCYLSSWVEGSGAFAWRLRRQLNWMIVFNWFNKLTSIHQLICASKFSPCLKMPSGTIGMSKMSSLSRSERFVRLSHLALFCKSIVNIDFPVTWTLQRCTCG